jgi:hypothetical protein
LVTFKLRVRYKKQLDFSFVYQQVAEVRSNLENKIRSVTVFFFFFLDRVLAVPPPMLSNSIMRSCTGNTICLI